MSKKRAFVSAWNFVKEEKMEIITIALIFFVFQIARYFIEEYAYQHQYLATYMPIMVVIVPVVLFVSRFAILHKKLSITKKWQTTLALKDRHYRSKIVITAFNASAFLYADIIVVYALAMSYFAFAFNASTESFSEAWHQLHLADISFVILSTFVLVCMHRKR
jgi:hypothetical protein